jgi:hypothetical protein
MSRTPEELRAAYEEGASIADLAAEEFMGVQTMRRVLGRAGTVIRQQGGWQPRKGAGKDKDEPWGDTFVNRPTSDPKVPRPTGVHKVFFPKDARGHRRRGRNL